MRLVQHLLRPKIVLFMKTLLVKKKKKKQFCMCLYGNKINVFFR